jgi:3-oxoacyl-[acyl-carrier protein] reductase
VNRIDLEGRSAVVTGAASGLGLAIARRFLESGASVVLWGSRGARLAAAASELEPLGDVWFQEVDVSDHDAVAAAAAEAFERRGRLDILVNNAGHIGDTAPAVEHSLEGWDAALAVNLSGTYYCCRAAIPLMLRGGYGRIVNVASAAAKEGNPNQVGYVAAKAGVVGMTKSLGKELAKTGVIVNAITPALFETPMLEDFFARMPPELSERAFATMPMGRIGRPDEFAAMVAWMASEECSFTTGATFDISGGRSTY